MPEIIESKSQVTEGSVDASVIQHRHITSYVKLWAATVLVAAGFAMAIYVFLSGSAQVEKFRDNAWTLLTVIVSSALGYLYGSRDRD